MSQAPSSSELDNKQPHRDMSSVLWLNRGPLSRGSQAKRVRHRGKTAKEKERDCTL